MNILVSACLLGEKCRYDGKSKPDLKVLELSKKHNLIPVCPEVLGGLSIPRNPCEIVGNRLISSRGEDRTEEYNKGAQIALETAKKHNCSIAVLKSKSPSCAVRGVYDGSFTKTIIEDKNGVTADLLLKNGIKVINENELDLIKDLL